ncbi:hypothetical protein Dsin_008660 [Dipteronia sinensis]|uniref:Uncharacterized protein n=1 Tax=Dipteronia sinensis TaxID=43782 RepID=A0AAE0ECS1_9ROSI|nr:hypothetical protein Dsin_008660 [Dipteronia sinensis]
MKKPTEGSFVSKSEDLAGDKNTVPTKIAEVEKILPSQSINQNTPKLAYFIRPKPWPDEPPKHTEHNLRSSLEETRKLTYGENEDEASKDGEVYPGSNRQQERSVGQICFFLVTNQALQWNHHRSMSSSSRAVADIEASSPATTSHRQLPHLTRRYRRHLRFWVCPSVQAEDVHRFRDFDFWVAEEEEDLGNWFVKEEQQGISEKKWEFLGQLRSKNGNKEFNGLTPNPISNAAFLCFQKLASWITNWRAGSKHNCAAFATSDQQLSWAVGELVNQILGQLFNSWITSWQLDHH